MGYAMVMKIMMVTVINCPFYYVSCMMVTIMFIYMQHV